MTGWSVVHGPTACGSCRATVPAETVVRKTWTGLLRCVACSYRLFPYEAEPPRALIADDVITTARPWLKWQAPAGYDWKHEQTGERERTRSEAEDAGGW